MVFSSFCVLMFVLLISGFIIFFTSVRVLNFLVSVEMMMLFLFLLCQIGWVGDISYLFVFLSVLVCESAISLTLLVSSVRFFDKQKIQYGSFFVV